MKIYKTAIIGCGNIASNFDKKSLSGKAYTHAGAYHLNPKTKNIAVSDLSQSRLDSFAKKWGNKSVYTDYRDMLKKEKIDILSICTPASSHLDIVKQACRYPVKAIYCEKPVTDTVKQAKEMISVCRKNNVILMINHQRRFGPFYRELKDKLSMDKLGTVQQAALYYTRGIRNTCTHMIDLFCFLLGEPKEVMAWYSKNMSPFENDPNIDGYIRFKSGITAWLKACDDRNYLILDMDIITTKARISLGDKIKCFKALPGKNLLKRRELFECKESFFRFEYPDYGMSSLTYGVSHIIDCIEHKKRPLSAGEDAIKSLQIIEKMLLSAKNNKRHKIAL